MAGVGKTEHTWKDNYVILEADGRKVSSWGKRFPRSNWDLPFVGVPLPWLTRHSPITKCPQDGLIHGRCSNKPRPYISFLKPTHFAHRLMCFPSKKTRANLEDQPQSQSKSTSTPGAATSTTTPAPKSQSDSQPNTVPSQPPTSTTTTANGTKMAPKVAIIIYSMYGHIAKSTSLPQIIFSSLI